MNWGLGVTHFEFWVLHSCGIGFDNPYPTPRTSNVARWLATHLHTSPPATRNSPHRPQIHTSTRPQTHTHTHTHTHKHTQTQLTAGQRVRIARLVALLPAPQRPGAEAVGRAVVGDHVAAARAGAHTRGQRVELKPPVGLIGGGLHASSLRSEVVARYKGTGGGRSAMMVEEK